MVRKPRFGYGKNMNPCIDCRIFMLKKAKKRAEKIGAAFIFTGEVLGQRPMSQRWPTLGIIEREAGLENQIVRPLSAKLFPPTQAEKEGLIQREKFLEIEGRSRKAQILLADKLRVTDYSCPGGGCLLTYREFACKLKDLFEHRKKVTLKEVQLLRIGRHFRAGKNKIIVGRNEAENSILSRLKMPNDYMFEAQDTGSPISLLQGPKTMKAIEKTAELTAYYSDKKQGEAVVRFGKEKLHKAIKVLIPSQEDVQKLSVVPPKPTHS